MKKDYSFGKTEIHDPFGPRRPKPAELTGKKSKQTYHFKNLSHTPPKITYQPHAQGFNASMPAPNVGKAVGMFLTLTIPLFIFIYGPEWEKVDPFMPRLVLSIIMLFLSLAGIYNLLRRHNLKVIGDEFEISSGYGILRSRRIGKIRDIKAARVDSKLRSIAEDVGDDEAEGEYSSNRFWYLAVHLRDGSYYHCMEGASKLNLNYMSYALKTAVTKRLK